MLRMKGACWIEELSLPLGRAPSTDPHGQKDMQEKWRSNRGGGLDASSSGSLLLISQTENRCEAGREAVPA